MGTADNSNSDLGAAHLLTWEESPTAGAGISAPSHDVVLHRLEFGKFCDSPNGPVEKVGGIAEHRVLGKSQDFPQSLSGYCNPSCIRVVNSEGESTPPACPHATVLVPCITGGDETHQIFCRIRQRAEDAESGVERKYNIARYLVPGDSQITPLLQFEVMQTIPLHGLSRSQVAPLLPLRGVPREFVPNKVTQAFAKQALIYAISGIPISFADVDSEQEFFECVTAVWLLLPPNLRPLLSAGWGVGGSVLGKMTIAYTDSRDPTVAVFSAADQTWREPAKVRVTGSNGTPELVDYYPERRRLGEDFWELFYGEDNEIDGQVLTFEMTQKRHLDWVTELPAMKLDGVLDWNNHLTRAFRTPGLKAHDVRLLERLRLWLHGETLDGVVAINATQFTYQKTRTEAFEKILEAIANPTERQRGEIALWETLAGALSPTLATLLADNERKGAFRGRLINAIRREDVSHTLEYLFHAADADQLDDLNTNANVCLQVLLDHSVKTGGSEILRLHSNLLHLDEMPGAYRNWAIQNRLEFLKLSAQAFGEVNQPIAERLFELSKDDAIPAMLNLDRNLAPDKKDTLTVEKLSASDREKFIWLLELRWMQVDGDVAARRENLYPWLKLLRPTNSDKALWSLALNEPVNLNDQCAEIALEVKHGRVPVTLWERVAATALEFWPKFSTHVRTEFAAWEGITKLFPTELEKLLFCRLNNEPARKVSRDISDAAQKCRPDPDEVNQLIAFWMKFDRFANFGGRLWQWAITDRPASGVSGLISRISRFEPFQIGINPTWSDLDEVVELASAAGQKDFFLKNEPRLWKSSLDSWQAFLMLRLMPQADITPTLEQLDSLIPYRERLRSHLEHVSAARRQRFQLASLNFHDLEYEKDQKLWRDDYSTCDLWAVFRGVPLRKQPRGALRSALRKFSDGLDGVNVIETRSRMCIVYLNSYSTSKDYEAALRKVLMEGLLPLLIKTGRTSEHILQLIKDTQKDLSPSWSGSFFRSLIPRMRNTGRAYLEPPGLEELLSTVVSGYLSEGSVSADVKSFFRV
jgi:hypothetical protein